MPKPTGSETRPDRSSVERNDGVKDYFSCPHESRLPLVLYIFSFAPPLPSIATQPWKLLRHPYIRYGFAVALTMMTSVAIPALDILFGRWSEYISPEDASPNVVRYYSNQSGYLVFVIGIVQMILTWAAFSLFVMSVEDLTSELRTTLLASLLAQDHAYFDEHGPGELAGCVSSDIDTIRIGFGEKIYYVSFSFGVLIASGIVGFVKAPSIAGVLFSIIPITMGVFAVLGYFSDKISAPALKLEANVATFMEQILNSPRIVHAFNISQALLTRLDGSFLVPLRRHSRVRAAMRSVELSSIYALLLWNYGAFFAWGAHQIAGGHTTIGPALTSFWSFMNCFFTIANVVPHFGAILKAIASLRNLRSIIERKPKIDVRDPAGLTLDLSTTEDSAQPSYSIENLTFAYPSRPTVPSLSNVNLTLEPGKITALVGPSGSGKSTLLALLLREFDPENHFDKVNTDDLEKSATPLGAGRIYFAGHDLRDVNTAWYRSQIGTVSQDPQLFPGSVFSNIVAGITRKNMQKYRASVSNDQAQLEVLLRDKVTKALVKAQAWSFVSKLPKGLDTIISGGGSSNLLSGGQRQRIAIARALAREPMILFLDEATSALDSATEEAIRLAIEQEQSERGMTCCIVAHRLSTVRRADTIVVLESGHIVDQGTHQELTSSDRKSSTYRDMAAHQQMLLETPGTQSVSSCSSEEDEESISSPNAIIQTSSDKDLNLNDSSQQGTSAKIGEKLAAGGQVLPALGDESRDLSFKRQAALIWQRANGLRLTFLFGFLAALLASGILPATGYLTGEATAALALPDPSDLRRQSYFWAIMMFVVGVASLILYVVQGLCLEGASGALSINLQHDSLKAIMIRDVSFFEMTADDGGGMAASLNTHPANITSITGNVLGNAIIAAGNIIGSIAAGLALTWRSTLVTFAPITLLAGAGCVTVSRLEQYETKCRQTTDQCSTFVSQHMSAIRTITALGRQREVLQEFLSQTQTQRPSRTSLLVGASGFAFGQSFMIVSSALVFYYAGNLYADGGVSLHSVFAIFELQIIAGFAASRLTAFIPDIARARASLRVVASWLAGGTSDFKRSESSHKTDLEGRIRFRNVELRYPQRPEHAALDDISLDIPKGHTVAFIGTSGSGKSSALSLLSCFYSPTDGGIMIDGQDMLHWDTIALRSRTALVSQQAVLFQGSIRWNVALGATNPDDVSDEQVREACRQANILDFVLSLPDGFDSQIGIKGSQLSGGQRQRLCIARALIRDPAVLLLDEATSALDAESEAAVQKALENASKGRTTILIAHRLSTVRNADRIYVFEDGKIVESGHHTELVSRKSRYLELMQAQM